MGEDAEEANRQANECKNVILQTVDKIKSIQVQSNHLPFGNRNRKYSMLALAGL